MLSEVAVGTSDRTTRDDAGQGSHSTTANTAASETRAGGVKAEEPDPDSSANSRGGRSVSGASSQSQPDANVKTEPPTPSENPLPADTIPAAATVVKKEGEGNDLVLVIKEESSANNSNNSNNSAADNTGTNMQTDGEHGDGDDIKEEGNDVGGGAEGDHPKKRAKR
ncbi:hypothetical protein PTSG_11481 [Salpingoeca rosetta]|nr:uncharacterized protein PTSG_11481 [Salpingoeca rosetta]EGD72983.1 hypothetical protein PTSG_11481 [Salpingoeca rosetta]|eukprot:XP_004987495.1 hypothetical protein PTSG_11481 [Salpingoeca rosetta]